MVLLDKSKEQVLRFNYQFQTNDGIFINYVRLEKKDGEVLKEEISNKAGYPLDPLLDSKIIDIVKKEVEKLESK